MVERTSEESKSAMRELFVEKHASHGVAAVFHEDEGEGYFVLYRVPTEEVLQQVQLYSRPPVPEIREEDVDLFWSSNEEKAAIAIWGRMRAVLGLTKGEQTTCTLENLESQAIEAEGLVSLFPEYVDRKRFLTARKRYWQGVLKETHPEAQLSDAPVNLLGTSFLVACSDSRVDRAAVFEDDGETGYLYLYSRGASSVQIYVHVYDRSKMVRPSKEDIEVLWSNDESKCAVRISGRFHGVIDVSTGQAIRSWMTSPATPGITDQGWLRAFVPM